MVVAPHAALADLPGGAKVVFSRLMIREDNKPDLIDGSVEQERKYFNRAHCYCSVEGAGAADFVETEFAWELRLSNRTQAVNVPAEIYSGADCDDDQNRMRCELLASIADLDVLTSRPSRALLRIHKVIEPLATQDKCGASERKALVWVGADGDSQGGPEYWASSGVDIDTNPPPTPRAVSAVPGENAITLRWSNPDERSSDVAYYQFLCAKRLSTDTVEPALKKPSHEPEFQSAADLCGLTAAGTQISFSAAEGSATAPAWLGDAELYVCGETVGASTSYRIPNLANDTPYQVAMVAVDLAGNAAGVFLTDDIKPVPVIDFWEDLHQRGGDAEGGFCLVASAYGDDGGITRGLRHFRDQTLSRTAAGRWLTRRYYEASAALAPALASAPGRAVAMVLLAPLVSLALLWHMLTLPGLLLLL
ncbi:MAG TPA: hypothetical protein PKU97_20110, partial [Kofleriaceae bacterium]|nr:hypothetical protein [Kofleriaceae bacterium]